MTNRENLIRTITRDRPSWVPYRYDGSLTILKPPIRVRPPEGGADDWGAEWVATTAPEGSYPSGKPTIDLNSLDQLRVPPTDLARVTDTLADQVHRLAKADTLVIGTSELALFERAELLLGADRFLMATVEEPAGVERLLDIVVEYQLGLVDAMLGAGVAGIRFTDDWGMQTSLLIAPEQWRRMIKPRLALLYQTVRVRGGIVFQHSCGHLEEIVPDLIEIGADVLDPCQPGANDILGWKKRYGDCLSFMGGLDTQGYLSFGSPAEVKGRVREVVSLMSSGGGYIAAPSHSISIPEQNRAAMLDALRELNAAKVRNP